MDIEGRVIVITGASQGIGEAISREFAKNKCKVVLAARSEDLLRRITRDINSTGGQSAYFKTDVSDPKDIRKLAEFASKKFGRIDVWINNAGIGLNYDSLSAREKWIEEIFKVNLLGVFWGMKYGARAITKNRSHPKGVIVNISSIGSEFPPFREGVLYNATKRGVDTLSEGIGLELMHSGIRVINVKPGFTRTNFSRNSMGKKLNKDPGSLPPLMRFVEPEIVAKKIISEVKKGKSSNRVFITTRDKLLVIIYKILFRFFGDSIRRSRNFD